MRIIPAIDIIDGKCVRLSKGDYTTKKVYNESPLEVAKQFEQSGIEYLHLVDLDGAKASKIINYKVLESIATNTNLKIDFGGGIKSNEDVKIAFNSGASQITGGSIAVKNPSLFEEWITIYTAEKIILGADANNGKIATNGWLEESNQDIIPFIQSYQSKGIEYVISTDIQKDGMLSGPSFELYEKILKECVISNTSTTLSSGSGKKSQKDLSTPLKVTQHIKLIASGGISTFEEIPKLAELGCEGVIIGKAIYENRISLRELESYIINK